MKGKGVKPIKGSTPGDEYVHIKIVTPSKLSREQKELLTQVKDKLNSKDDAYTSFMRNFVR